MQPTRDERVLAALSHAGIVVNIINMAGMIAAALIWTAQRERSRYVSAHALQSLVYQGIVLLISTFLFFSWGLCLVLSLLPALLRPELYRASPPSSLWLAMIGLLIPLGFGAVATLYGLYAAFLVYRGRPFHYPLIGRLLPRDLDQAVAPPAPPAPPATPPAPASDEAATVTAAPPAPQAPPAPHTRAPLTTRRRTRRRPPDEGS